MDQFRDGAGALASNTTGLHLIATNGERERGHGTVILSLAIAGSACKRVGCSNLCLGHKMISLVWGMDNAQKGVYN